MKNPNITAKDRGLIKGAIRRVFSRSELRRESVRESMIDYFDETRPRVKKWSMCPQCKTPTPTYLLEVDHLSPIIPVNMTLEDMSWDDLVNRVFCDKTNLRAICKTCHKSKTKDENFNRRKAKKLIK